MKIIIAFFIIVSSCTLKSQNVQKLIKKLSDDCLYISQDSLLLPNPINAISLSDLLDSLNNSKNKLKYYTHLKNVCDIGVYGEGSISSIKNDLFWFKTIRKTDIPPNLFAKTAINIMLERICRKKRSNLLFNYKKALKRQILPWLIEYYDTLQNNYCSYSIKDYILETEDLSVLKKIDPKNFEENVKLEIIEVAEKKKNHNVIYSLIKNESAPKWEEQKIDALIQLGKTDSINLTIISFLKKIYSEDTNRIIPSSLTTHFQKIYNCHKNLIYYGKPPRWGPDRWFYYAELCFFEKNWEDCQKFLIKAIRVTKQRPYAYNNEKAIIHFGQTLYSQNIKLTQEFIKWFPKKK